MSSANLVGKNKIQMRVSVRELAKNANVLVKDVPELLNSLQADGIVISYFYNGKDEDVLITVKRGMEIGLSKDE